MQPDGNRALDPCNGTGWPTVMLQIFIMYKTLFVLLATPLIAAQCGDRKNANNPTCLEGKIIRSTCASVVVQVYNNDTIGEDGWKDMMGSDTAKTYDNVFSVVNNCKLPADIKPGTKFYFTVEKPQPSDCVACMMYDAPPKTQFDIKNASTQPCGK